MVKHGEFLFYKYKMTQILMMASFNEIIPDVNVSSKMYAAEQIV